MISPWELLLRHGYGPLRELASEAARIRAGLAVSQWDAPEIIRERQRLQVQRMLEFAYEHVSHYRDEWNAIGFQPGDFRTFEDLQSLPILSKATVRNTKFRSRRNLMQL